MLNVRFWYIINVRLEIINHIVIQRFGMSSYLSNFCYDCNELKETALNGFVFPKLNIKYNSAQGMIIDLSIHQVLEFLEFLPNSKITRISKMYYGLCFNITCDPNYKSRSKPCVHFYIHYYSSTNSFRIILNRIYDLNNWYSLNNFRYYYSKRIQINNTTSSFVKYLKKNDYIDNDLCNIYVEEKDESLNLLDFLQKNKCITFIYYFQDNIGRKCFVFNNREVQQMVVIFPWAFCILTNMFKQISCIMLDATFYSCDPYTASIGLVIIRNVSIPIFLSIGPSEHNLLFKRAYDCLAESGINKEILRRIPILTDMGRAIKKFAVDWGIKRHYYCIRHVIESFGSSSKIGIWLSALFKIMNMTYLKYSYKYLRNLFAYPESTQSRELGITPEQVRKFCSIFHIEDFHEFDDDIFDIEICQVVPIARIGIPSTTNHLESLHSKLNAIIHPNYTIENKLIAVLNHLIEVSLKIVSSRPDYKFMQRTFKEKLKEVKMNSIPSYKYNYSKYFELDTGERFYLCPLDCGYDYYYSELYGTPFPCIHTYQINKKNNIRFHSENIVTDYIEPEIDIFFITKEINNDSTNGFENYWSFSQNSYSYDRRQRNTFYLEDRINDAFSCDHIENELLQKSIIFICDCLKDRYPDINKSEAEQFAYYFLNSFCDLKFKEEDFRKILKEQILSLLDNLLY